MPKGLIICMDKANAWKNIHNVNIWEIDVSIVTTQMMLEATNLGLGSTWVGHFCHNIVRENFKIPEFVDIVAILPIGYPASDTKPHPLHDTRFDIEHIVFYNSFADITHVKNTVLSTNILREK